MKKNLMKFLYILLFKVLVYVRAFLNGLVKKTFNFTFHLTQKNEKFWNIKHLILDDFSEFIYKKMGQNREVPSGFYQLMILKSISNNYYKSLGETSPEFFLNDKVVGMAMAKSCDVVMPKTYFSDTKISDLDFEGKYPCVLKPTKGAGSKNVFYVFDETNIQEVINWKKYDSLEALFESLKSRDQQWILEEMVVKIDQGSWVCRDLKFYTFYGEVKLVLEVQRYPEPKYCFYDRDGNYVDTKKYPIHTLFNGEGFKLDQIKRVEELSLNCPCPFLRIDFIDNYKEMKFLEFTPRPGKFETFSWEINTWLGDEFLKAESRLRKDLIMGKSFEQFNALRMKNFF